MRAEAKAAAPPPVGGTSGVALAFAMGVGGALMTSAMAEVAAQGSPSGLLGDWPTRCQSDRR